MDYSKLIDIGSKVSLAVVLMFIIYTGSTGYWVYGSQYKDLQADRDTWKQLALKGTNLADQSARRITGFNPNTDQSPHPLPTDAKASNVKKRLQAIEQAIKYKTEPTDAPLQ